ncbi:MAG: cell division protein FtsQ [Polyangiales bacterium]
MKEPEKRKRRKESTEEELTAPQNRRRKKAVSAPPEEAPTQVRFAPIQAFFGGIIARAKRPAVLMVKFVVAAAFVAGGVAGWRLIERYAKTAPYFEVAQIEVEGDERVERDALLRTAGIALGDNVFSRTPEQVEDRLERHPWIAEANVERRLPGFFRVRVREHRAVAVLMLAGKGYLVGDDATLFKELSVGDPVDLPVITGLDSQRFLSEVAHRSEVLMNVVTLMHDFRSAGLWRREPIAEIHVEPSDDLSVYLNDDAMYVRLGEAPWRPKLSRLRRILDRLDSEESRPEYVFLDNTTRPDRVTVRLRELELPASDEAPTEPS